MHQIIKQRGLSKQLFIKITFAFMKIFDFLVKIAILKLFSERFASCLTARDQHSIAAVTRDANLMKKGEML